MVVVSVQDGPAKGRVELKFNPVSMAAHCNVEIKMFEVMLRQVGAEEYSISSKEEVDIKISHQ